ncbi:MAG: hypothetical protein ACRD3E_08060 [Terriglobales bacterium]
MMTTISTAAAVALAAICASALSGRAHAQNSDFHAQRVVRTAHLNFQAAPEVVFPLFTPLGEKHWAKGWDPKLLYPADGNPVEGMLFYTADHEGTWWWLTRYDPANHTVEYHVVAPAGLARNIRVQCAVKGGGTEVTVTDTYIGLNEHGNEFVRSLDEASYAQKMKGWEAPIKAYLQQSR